MTRTRTDATVCTQAGEAVPEHIRTGLRPETLRAAFLDNLNFVVGRPLELATRVPPVSGGGRDVSFMSTPLVLTILYFAA
jgi:hypothetical protein